MKRDGFSLLEVIAVLVLTGLVGLMAGLMIVPLVQRYALEREAAAGHQKAEVALARLAKELTWADPASVSIDGDGQGFRWQSRHPQPSSSSPQQVRWSGLAGEDLALDGVALVDNVAAFGVSAGDGTIRVTLRLAETVAAAELTIALRDDI